MGVSDRGRMSSQCVLIMPSCHRCQSLRHHFLEYVGNLLRRKSNLMALNRSLVGCGVRMTHGPCPVVVLYVMDGIEAPSVGHYDDM